MRTLLPACLMSTLLTLVMLNAFDPAVRVLVEKNSPPESRPTRSPAKKRILFISGGCSHGPGQHEHEAGCALLARSLNENLPTVQAEVLADGWPKDAAAFENVAAVVMYGDGGEGHMVNPYLEQTAALMKKGIGLACLHYAVEVPKGAAGNDFLDWIGGYFETDWSVNPTWKADFKALPTHPVTRGVKPFGTYDEWYYHMRFREGMKGVTPLLTAVPPASTLDRKDGPHENNPHVRAEQGKPQHLAWCRERPDGGRGFGITGGHFHRNWSDENYRKLVLNAIAWVAKAEVPAAGVASQPPTPAELAANPCKK
ncbi:MAG: ThuA domain-containing protein [Ferruginibacter sp.]|nr:ThuA domain-containing protein [Cytophagales bacterium]